MCFFFKKSGATHSPTHLEPAVGMSIERNSDNVTVYYTLTHIPGEDVCLVSGWFLLLLAMEDELRYLVELLDAASRHFCQTADR